MEAEVKKSAEVSYEPFDQENFQLTSHKEIFMQIFKSSSQTALGYICSDIVFGFSIHYASTQVGAYGSSGFGFITTITGIFLLPIGYGLNQALNLQVSQALGGKQFELVKVYLPLTLVIHLIFYIPLVALVVSLLQVMSHIIPEQDRAAVIEQSWIVLPWIIISTFLIIIVDCIKSFMNAHQIFAPTLLIYPLTTGLHIFWCWLFTYYLGLGDRGVGMATFFTEFLNLMILCLISKLSTTYSKPFKQLEFSTKSVTSYNLSLNYIKAAAPMIIHLFADFLGFYQLLIFAMTLGGYMFSAQLAFSNTSAFYFKIPLSISIALITFVGNEMGQNNWKNAQRYCYVAFLMFLSISSTLMVTMWINQGYWAQFYSANSKETFNIILDTLPFFLVGCVLIDGIQGILSGMLKGIEKKSVVSNSTTIVYYFIGAPLIAYLTFSIGFGLNLIGIWLGFGICNLILLIIFLQQLISTDWSHQCDIVRERLEEQEKLRQQNEIEDK